jgi:hypothetical protein
MAFNEVNVAVDAGLASLGPLRKKLGLEEKSPPKLGSVERRT